MNTLSTERKEIEMRLRIIGLCEAYGRRQTPGSAAAAHAARMLALYRRHYTRLTGREPTAAEVGSRMFEVGSINNGGFAAPIMNSTASGGACHGVASEQSETQSREPNSALQTSNLKLPTSSEALSKPTAAEVAEAMWRRYTDMHAAVTNSAPPGHNCHASVRPCPYNKGTTREHRTQGTPHRVYRVDQRQPTHKQVGDLTAAIERAARAGQRLEAVIRRPEFGELTLDCGNPGRKNDSQDSRGHGVQHALEVRHGISVWAIAETLLTGIVTQSESHSSRLLVETEKYRVVLEREIQKGSGRINEIRAKLHTAMKKP